MPPRQVAQRAAHQIRTRMLWGFTGEAKDRRQDGLIVCIVTTHSLTPVLCCVLPRRPRSLRPSLRRPVRSVQGPGRQTGTCAGQGRAAGCDVCVCPRIPAFFYYYLFFLSIKIHTHTRRKRVSPSSRQAGIGPLHSLTPFGAGGGCSSNTVCASPASCALRVSSPRP
ncbi:hypothetical protein MAPG_08119 [Magnaporthiopsis poae ATCC 64411]|uniref:Uncharacterized protein n=1 Tax=Magnaporthiopsis poae (strain ATCC 64411 / 73-15) TaxID=644358 RepID=A0A0C4E6I1_MAGP6|nr:hypothetical protein MAPG_08119 [Magnaporthiopsis poae ATCC 64411]